MGMNEEYLINIAPLGTASQSSLSEYPTAKGAQSLVEESALQLSCHTNEEDSPWWRLDFERAFTINRIEIFNCSEQILRDRASDLAVEISLDGNRWQLIHTGFLHFGDGIDAPSLVLELAGKLSARHLRLSLPGKQKILCLRLIKVFANKNDVLLQKLWSDWGWPLSENGSPKPGYDLVDIGPATSPDTEVTGVMVARYGRFGNNIFQTINAVVTAQRMGWKVVVAPALQIGAPDGETIWKGVRLITPAAPAPSGKYLRGSFFYTQDQPEGWYEGLGWANKRKIARELFPDFLGLFKDTVDPARRRELAIHMGSGDIFGDSPHPAYVQPPLAFYLRVVEKLISNDKIDSVCVDRGSTKSLCECRS